MLENLIAQIVVAVLLLAIGFFLRRGLTAAEDVFKTELQAVKNEQRRMNGSVKEIVNKYESCRDELPDRFVNIIDFKDRKKDVDSAVKQLFGKLNPMASDIAVIKSKVEKDY